MVSDRFSPSTFYLTASAAAPDPQPQSDEGQSSFPGANVSANQSFVVDAMQTRTAFGFLKPYFALSPISSSLKVLLFKEEGQDNQKLSFNYLLGKSNIGVYVQETDPSAGAADDYDHSKVLFLLRLMQNGQMVLLSANSGAKEQETGQAGEEGNTEENLSDKGETGGREIPTNQPGKKNPNQVDLNVLGYCSVLTKKQAEEFESDVKSGKVVAWIVYFGGSLWAVLFVTLVIYWLREGYRKDEGKRRKKKKDITEG